MSIKVIYNYTDSELRTVSSEPILIMRTRFVGLCLQQHSNWFGIARMFVNFGTNTPVCNTSKYFTCNFDLFSVSRWRQLQRHSGSSYHFSKVEHWPTIQCTSLKDRKIVHPRARSWLSCVAQPNTGICDRAMEFIFQTSYNLFFQYTSDSNNIYLCNQWGNRHCFNERKLL